MTALEYIEYLQSRLNETGISYTPALRFDEDAVLIDKLRDKIEELTEELELKKKECREIADDYQEIGTFYYNETVKTAELQKQVDELKSENTELYKEHTALIAGSILKKQEIAKDTAKEILTKANELWLDTINPNCLISKIERWIKERYSVEVE